MIKKEILMKQASEAKFEAEYYRKCISDIRDIMKQLRKPDIEAKYSCVGIETFLNDILAHEYGID